MADSNASSSDADVKVPGGGPYSPGPNKFTGGGTTVDDVSPLPDRTDTTSAEATEKQDTHTRGQA